MFKIFKAINDFVKETFCYIIIGMLVGYIVIIKLQDKPTIEPINMPSIKIEGFNFRDKKDETKFEMKEL